MKTLILMAYYDRPHMVRLALDSVVAQNADYHLAIVDDGSINSIRDILKDYSWTTETVTVFDTEDSPEQKIANGGSRLGHCWNLAIEQTNADIGVMLCDDDALFRGYLDALSKFYETHDVKYSYGHVLIYDPRTYPEYGKINGSYDTPLNSTDRPINPFCRVDASQVSWRMRDWKEAGIKFPSPQTAALDAVVYQQMYEEFGPCRFNGLFTQYKGVFPDQLGYRAEHFKVIDSGPDVSGLV